MATLTGQLQTETRGKSMLPGQAAAPSFVNSLLSVATGAIQGYGPMQKRMEAQKTKDALNDAEQAQFDFLNQKEQELNPAFKAAGDELAMAQTAEKQGRAPAGSSELRAEKVVSDLYSRFPADKAAIAQYLQGRGFDHYLFQSVKQEEKWKTMQQDSERAMVEASYKAASDNGLVDPTDFEASVKAGQAFLQAQSKLELAIKAGAEARAQSQENRAQAEWELNRAGKQAVDAAAELGGVHLNSIIPQLSSLIATTNGHEDRQAMITKIRPQIVASVETFRATQLARMQGLPKDARDAFNAQVDAQLKNIDTLFNVDFEANKRTLDNMKLKFQLDDATALPAYNRMVRLFGQATANSIFDNDPASSLPPDVVDQIRKEIKGFAVEGDVNEASVMLSNIAAIRSGVKGLGDMPESEARRVMPALLKTSTATQVELLKGRMTPDNVSAFLNSNAQIVNAASELQPGLTDIKSTRAAIQGVANPQMAQVLTALDKDPAHTQRAQALIIGNRGATAQLLRVAQQSGPDTSADGVYTLKYDSRNGTYKVHTDQKKLDEIKKRMGGPVLFDADYPGPASTGVVPSPAGLQEKADAMNMALNHLIATSGLDDNLPKGATTLGLRNWYANGTPPVTATGENALSPSEMWTKSYNELYRAVQDVAVTGGASIVQTPTASFKGASISPGDAVSRFQSHGVPAHIAQGIVGNLMAESGLRTGAVGDGGKALSLAQWHPDRRDHAAKAGFDLSNPQDAIDFVMWELNNTEAAAKKKLANAKTVQEAADIFALYFLRPQGAQTGRAENVHNIDGRRKYAQGLAQR